MPDQKWATEFMEPAAVRGECDIMLLCLAKPDAGVEADSIYIESGISITSMSLSVTPDDATSAELSFTINDPKHILTTDIS